MSGATSGELRTCGCCEGVRDRVPARIANRPGLGEIGYRVGDYHQFKQSLLAGLTDGERQRLGALLTRDDDDFAIGLIDAWAMVGDVLTFYVERTAQEHYLAPATERRSVAALVHLIGYRPRPGVAASTALAFTLEASPLPPRQAPPGAPERVPIAAGTKVQSIPGPDERPQTFETTEAIEALVAWNRLTPRLSEKHEPAATDTDAYLAGSALNLGPGDMLLFVGAWDSKAPNDHWDMQRVIRVEPDATASRTHVYWESGLKALKPTGSPDPVRVYVLRQRASLFGYNAPDPRLFDDKIRQQIKSDLVVTKSGETEILGDWDFPPIDTDALDLDVLVQGIKPGGWVVLTNPTATNPALAGITQVNERSRSDYAISNRVTSLAVNREDASFPTFGDQKTRGTAILLGSAEFALAEPPIDTPVAGMKIELPAIQAVDPLPAARKVVVRGRLTPSVQVTAAGDGLAFTPDDAATPASTLAEGGTLSMLGYRQEPGETGQRFWRLQSPDGIIGEVAVQNGTLAFLPSAADAPIVAEVAQVAPAATGTVGKQQTLKLTAPLANVYDRPTVEIFGNIAAATHGESIRGEVLGSGDAAKPYQQFTLDKGPLTYVSAATPSGGASTLEVWVNDVEWEEALTFFDTSPRDRVFVTGASETGETAVRFGDGVNGARPPTGFENIRATYRTGIGAAGNLARDRLTLLMTRPLGVKAVTNPVPASGGQDAETADDARTGAPLTVLTLDRIVSLPDYEDFARAFAGIAKAAAVDTWDGARRGVLLTVAGIDGAQLAAGMDTFDNLVDAIADAGNPRLAVQIRSYRPRPFCVTASLLVETRHDPDIVLAQARAVLLARFSFAARSFGQLVSLSEVTTALQNVPGVVAVDVNQLYKDGDDALLNPYLTADAPKPGGPPAAQGAELLTLDPASLAAVTVQS